MAAELKREFPGTDVKLIQSSGGRFEVTADGLPIFSKATTGRHAEAGEVVKRIREVRGGT